MWEGEDSGEGAGGVEGQEGCGGGNIGGGEGAWGVDDGGCVAEVTGDVV